MEILTIIYYAMLVIWYIASIFLIIFMYQNNYSPYIVEFNEQHLKNLPSDLLPGEISMLVNHKIEPCILTTTILTLINKKAIILSKKEQEYIFEILTPSGRMKLTRSETVIRDFLLGISKNRFLSLNEMERYCGTKRRNTEFLFQYDLWKAMIHRESSRKHFFEDKKGYGAVKFIRNVGILLLITNILGGYHLVTGYGTILPILFIPFFFSIAYKRTQTYQEEYVKWLAFKNYLSEITSYPKPENIQSFIMPAIVFGKLPALKECEPTNKNIIFADCLNHIVLKCYRHAYFNGNRSVKSLWNFK